MIGLGDRLALMQVRLGERPHLARLGALFSDTVLLMVDGAEYYLVFDRGQLARIVEGPSRKTPYQFGIVTDAEALTAFWSPLPAPGFHDLFALVKIGRAEVRGDMLRLVKNLRFIKEFLALGREAVA
ncbi:hypothetical protein [Pseudooceanicola sp.]|uniref:hypothetical protein n=1 Tax=Pseudooceanicola sp. TaxID=1914328 RepID=UPI0035C767E7